MRDKSVKITIHRGTREIGGTCVQVTAGDRSILLDAGVPLGQSTSHVDLSRVDFTDIFVSHPHQDHFGLIETIPPDKTVHIGETARQLIAATRLFLGKPPLTNTFSPLHNRKWVTLGPNLRVKPYLMDHSCVDAFGIFIEVEGRRLYYSGDFRAHGRRQQVFDGFLADPPRNVDLLLMEGTMIGRDNTVYPNEDAVETSMLEMLRELDDRACFLICSGQHIDRLCAAFSACLKAGRIFVTDIYTAYILSTVADRFPAVPALKASSLRVLTKGFTAGVHYQKLVEHPYHFGTFARDIFRPETMIDIAEIVAHPSRYFLKISNFSDLLERLEQCGVIYSMWSGYLQEPKYQGIRQNPKVAFHEIHTSGHAVHEDLQRMVAAVQAKQLVPVHTERGDAYRGLFGESVIFLRDGEPLEI